MLRYVFYVTPRTSYSIWRLSRQCPCLQREVFLEAQVQNMIPVPMYVEAIQFEPNPLFDLRDLNTVAPYVRIACLVQPIVTASHIILLNYTLSGSAIDALNKEQPEAQSTFGMASYIGPQDVRQYLYRMTPKPGDERNAQVCRAHG